MKKSQKARKTYREERKKLNDQKNIELDTFFKHLQKKYSTLFPVQFLLEKKMLRISDNEYNKDYSDHYFLYKDHMNHFIYQKNIYNIYYNPYIL